jgi:hypothetical protein
MKLCVVRTHYGAIVTDQLITGIAEVAEELIVQETLLLKIWIHLISLRMGISTV